MEVTAKEKLTPPFLAACLRKIQKKNRFLFTRASSKRFQTFSVMKWSSLETFTKRVMHMQTVFYFLFKFMFLRKNDISEKELKVISPSPPGKKNKSPRISTIAQPHILILFKNFQPHPHLKVGGRDYALYMTNYKGENKYTNILYDRYSIYRTAKS